jgi:hexosaminidase
MQTLAVKCWSGKLRELPYAEFDKKRKELSEAPGVNELALFGEEQREVYSADEVKAGTELPFEEIGYDYTISFTLEGAPEQKGTELFRSANAVFYLSDPESGQLGFAREGYLNKFNFRIPQSGKVEIKIQGNNKFTRLYVDGRMRQELGPLTLYAMKPNELVNFQSIDENAWKPVMYNPSAKMYYQRTLVFPLRKAGDFKSRISNFKVYNYLKDK